ncbi:hypothetical protein ACTG9Q_01640 [Actinokineospora sp. 24-640]
MRSATSTLSCALALAATAVFAGSASAAPTVPFAGSHLDRCLSSGTSGELAWQDNRLTAVAVTGSVTLRDPRQCTFPSTPVAVAVFTAYSGLAVIDTRRESTPVGAKTFRFVLTEEVSPVPVLRPIDRVTVQVCHTAPSTSPVRVTCGEVSTYKP